MRRFIVTALLCLVAFLLQTTVLQWISLAGVVPNLILIIVVSCAYMRGRKEGMYVGFTCGLLIDLVYGDLVGVNAILFVIVGYVVGICNEIYYRDELSVPIILVAISDFLFGFVFYVLNFLLRGRFQVVEYVTKTILPEVVYTVLVALVIYRLLHGLNYWLEQREETGEAL